MKQEKSKLKEPPFSITAKILNLTASICEALATINPNQKSAIVPHLRKKNRIKTIHSTLAIENNTLSIEQVSAIIEGKRVLGSPREIKEVQNAYLAYEQLMALDALNMEHLLKAHALMMGGLVDDSGAFRSGGVGILSGKNVIHIAPPAKLVAEQMENLFSWYKESALHPLVKSSIFHYEFEFIHPFSDGNGRMGRMWQSKLLGEWREIFYFLPVEELIIKTQSEYYAALSKSDESGDSAVFVEYMLQTILDAVIELKNGTIFGIINGTINNNEKAVIRAIKANPRITKVALAEKLNLSLRTIGRIIESLIKNNKIRRVGARKNGHYEVVK